MRSIMLAVVLLAALGLPATTASAQDRKFLTCSTLNELALQLDTIVQVVQPLTEDPSLADNGCFYQSYTQPPFGPNYQVLVQLWYHVDANGLFYEIEWVETQGNDGVNTPRFWRLIATRSITEFQRPMYVTARIAPWRGHLSLRAYGGPTPDLQAFVESQ